jgi:hypothetical protein
LRSYKGLLGWSQGSRAAESYEVFNETFDATRLKIVNMDLDLDLATLQNNMETVGIVKRVLLENVALATVQKEEVRHRSFQIMVSIVNGEQV